MASHSVSYTYICIFSFISLCLATGPPLPPTDVVADCTEPERAHVSWRPQFQGGSSQTFFVQININGTWVTLLHNITDDRQDGRIFCIVDQLETNVQYEFRVGAVNADNEEKLSVDSANCKVKGIYILNFIRATSCGVR